MKRILFSFAAACFALTAFGIAASQAWVTNYVAQAIATSRAELQATATVTATNGTRVVSAGAVRLVVEDCTDAALLATNCTGSAVSRGVTNGVLFVWNGAGAYVNPCGVVSCTASNMVYSGVASVYTNGLVRFAGFFDAEPVLVQPHVSHSVTNGMMEVSQ
jgi:hypothetical protein